MDKPLPTSMRELRGEMWGVLLAAVPQVVPAGVAAAEEEEEAAGSEDGHVLVELECRPQPPSIVVE